MCAAGAIHFRTQVQLEGYFLSIEGFDELVFRDSTDMLRISITGNILELGVSKILKGLVCSVEVAVEASEEQIQFVDECIAWTYPVDENGTRHRRQFDGPSIYLKIAEVTAYTKNEIWQNPAPGIIKIFEEAIKLCRNKVNRLVKILRWLCDSDSSSSKIDDSVHLSKFEWRTFHDRFYAIGLQTQYEIRGLGIGGLKWGEQTAIELRSIWAREMDDEPLAHQLYREARSLLGTSPSAALLIAHSALEVALKQHIARLTPPASWLLGKLSSPPIDRIFREYIPIIHEGNPRLGKWQNLKKSFEKISIFSETRNKIAHLGLNTKTDPFEFMSLARDFLYAIDYLEGRDWATRHISSAFLNKVEWPQNSVY